MTLQEKKDFYVIKKRLLEDKLQRIQLCVATLESINDKWFTYTQQIVTMKRKIQSDLTNKQAKKEIKFTLASNINVILPHLSLPTFDGDPRQWLQFW
ncbi:unnamed protein product, partial [Brugia timori]|uniref:Uncharacterized protein n=1 Tax=Brugia timori TaxID=42155 RepID=A0A0R3QGN4_9BILA